MDIAILGWMRILARLVPLLVIVFAQQSDNVITTTTNSKNNPWPPATSINPSIQELFREYNNIFRHGNRNAASHRWATFLLDRADQMTIERLEFFLTGFCAVSGSPVRPNDYNRYRLTLPKIGGRSGKEWVSGFMHYCCWPCVCDTQDFIRIDTLNITSSDGISRQRHFTVIGNPCDHPEQLQVPFVQPFGHWTTTLAETAREVRCLEGGILEGATLSDHGFIIIGMFFDAFPATDEVRLPLQAPEPGRISTAAVNGKTIPFQDEREWENLCKDRADNGYNSGMGEIFRKVCSISPISELSLAGPITSAASSEGSSEESEQVQSPKLSTQHVEPSCNSPGDDALPLESVL